LDAETCAAKDKLNKNIFFSNYADRLTKVISTYNWTSVSYLADDLIDCWVKKKTLYICGNGGSAGNAIHLANDFIYGIAKKTGGGIRVQALPANSAILTCLGNDVGFDLIFSEQLAVLAQEGDLLLALSGSGNSPNIINAIKQATKIGMKTYAILGYSGGACKSLVDCPIHFPVDDMQISEDLQLIVGHMLMQRLASYSNVLQEGACD
jgi:D-sedoheptulose 7-phosphate isomerase